MSSYANQLGTASQQPAAPPPQTLNEFANDFLQASERLYNRLTSLRDRLLGQGREEPNGKAPVQSGVIPMTASAHSNVYASHKVMDEIEKLIG
jgi:hypothetical protein